MIKDILKDTSNRLINVQFYFSKLLNFILSIALLLAYMKGNGGLCRALVKSGLVALGTLNNAEISIFNCAVASKVFLCF